MAPLIVSALASRLPRVPFFSGFGQLLFCTVCRPVLVCLYYCIPVHVSPFVGFDARLFVSVPVFVFQCDSRIVCLFACVAVYLLVLVCVPLYAFAVCLHLCPFVCMLPLPRFGIWLYDCSLCSAMYYIIVCRLRT